MPTYEYICDACGHQFDEFQSITAKPLRKCPECGKSKLRRLIGTGAGVIFRGSGFYQTDYRSDSYQKAAKAENESAAPKTDSSSADKPSTSATSDTSTSKAESMPKSSDKPKGGKKKD
ncbi:MAG: zinc ribbon domain-containing protein [Phycisphaeraceae bacterium]|nr:zinc ribbon domain-containing protein [Phycisphaeraceae bacterium]